MRSERAAVEREKGMRENGAETELTLLSLSEWVRYSGWSDRFHALGDRSLTTVFISVTHLIWILICLLELGQIGFLQVKRFFWAIMMFKFLVRNPSDWRPKWGECHYTTKKQSLSHSLNSWVLREKNTRLARREWSQKLSCVDATPCHHPYSKDLQVHNQWYTRLGT